MSALKGVGLTVLRAPAMMCWNLLCGGAAGGSAPDAKRKPVVRLNNLKVRRIKTAFFFFYFSVFCGSTVAKTGQWFWTVFLFFFLLFCPSEMCHRDFNLSNQRERERDWRVTGRYVSVRTS